MIINRSTTPKKEVIASIEVLPNYLWHIFASSNIWDKDTSPYSDKYGHTVLQTDREFIYNHRELIAWANGKSGDLTGGIFFYPLREKIDIGEYIALLNRLTDEMKGHVPDELYRICLDVTAIMGRNYRYFKDNVWPEIKPLLEDAKAKLEDKFEGHDPISEWEKGLGLTYPEDKKELVLSYANQLDCLPSANDISPVRNNFGITADESTINYVYDLIIHEIGIFTIKPVIDSLYANKEINNQFNLDNNIIYIAFETFIEKKKDDIFRTKPKIFLPQWADQYKWFYEYYKQYDAAGAAGIDSLLKNAITAFGVEFDPSLK
jgi:hypothetical protein